MKVITDKEVFVCACVCVYDRIHDSARHIILCGAHSRYFNERPIHLRYLNANVFAGGYGRGEGEEKTD